MLVSGISGVVLINGSNLYFYEITLAFKKGGVVLILQQRNAYPMGGSSTYPV